MSQQSEDRTAVYRLRGEALDQETIIRQRGQIEEYLVEDGINFSEVELFWNLNHDGHFDFEMVFYA